PIARKILRALLDRSVLLDDARTSDTDERRKLESLVLRGHDQILEHFHQPLDGGLTRRLVVGISPQLGLPDVSLRQIVRFLPARLDHAATDIGAADINGQDAVATLEDPGWRQMQRSDQRRLIGMKADRHHLQLEILGAQDDLGARDRKLAEPAVAKAAADHDALGLRPGLGLEEAPRYIGQFLRELLDRAVQQGRSLGVVTDQHVVEGLLADLLRGHVAERILARFAQGLAPAVEDLAESTLGGTVAQEALLVLQFDIEAVDIDRG